MISERIETERLLLRPPEERDLDGWAALYADPRAAAFIGGPQSRAAAWRHMASEAGSWRMKGFGMFSVIEKESGCWIGRVGPHWPEGYPALEFGWSLLLPHWGRGLAFEAAQAALDAVFGESDCAGLIHLIDPANDRSIRLAERLGATRGPPAPLPPPYESFRVEAWQLPRERWRQARARRC